MLAHTSYCLINLIFFEWKALFYCNTNYKC